MEIHKGKNLKLNIGSGEKRLPGYVGVDVVPRGAADIIAPAHKIPLDDEVADEVMAIHLLEHMVPWVAEDALREWKRLLKPGGKLVLELPNFKKCIENILSGFTKGGKHPDQMGWWGCFGDTRLKDEHMLHRFGYTPASLTELLERHGFTEIKETPTQFHRAGKYHRDMRIEAVRP